MTSKAVGIDLGTTNSLIAQHVHRQTEVAQDKLGYRLIPTVVSFTNKERIIGTLAKSQCITNTENTIFGTKRLIGRKFNEEVVQQSIKKWPFKVLQDGNNTLIEVQYLNNRETFPPEVISAMILTKLKEIAEVFFEESVTDAVISVPAAFNDGQRQATRDAGKIAGLNVIRIINEPTAAAIAYGLNNSDKMDNKYVLVYDLGGGTFDVSILKITNKTFDVIVSKGDLLLGGDDFDEKIWDIIMDKFTKKNKIVEMTDKRAALRLMRECEIAKQMLSHCRETDIEIDDFFNGLDLSEKISRIEFETACNQMFNKTITLVKDALKEGNLNASVIHDIVLVGGSTRIPKIRVLLQNLFEGMTLKESINPDEAVVQGAAIQAYLLSGMDSNNDNEIVVIESINASLGIDIIGGRMDTIINRGAKIPIKKMKTYTTTADKQIKCPIIIFEGERPMTKDNHDLCEFTIYEIPPKAPGVETFEVTFEVDKDLILHAWALVKSTKHETLPIIKEAGRMSQDKIEHHINEAKKFKEQDMIEYTRVTAKANLEIRVYSLMATGNSHEISEATAMLKWLEEHQGEKQEEYEANLEKLG